VVVDPKSRDFRRFAGATVVKPNLHEAHLALGRDLRTEADAEQPQSGQAPALVAGVSPAAQSGTVSFFALDLS
jgi:bifunctional ADP-heptose synthase (sugar kinase/adenylyltransferase)